MKPLPRIRRGGAKKASASSLLAAPAVVVLSSLLFVGSASAAVGEYYEWHASSPSIETAIQAGGGYAFLESAPNQSTGLNQTTIRDSSQRGHVGGYGLIDGNAVLHVGETAGSITTSNKYNLYFTGQPDLLVRGTGTSVTLTNGTIDAGASSGLAAIAVDGLISGNVWFDASGYVLVSAPQISLAGTLGTFAPETKPKDAPAYTNSGADKTLLVFQNQNANGGKFDISQIANDSRLANGGIYINTAGSSFELNSKAQLKSHADIVIDLGDENLTLNGASILSGYDANGSYQSKFASART